MKRSYTLFTFVLFTVLGAKSLYAQTVNIPDANFKAYLVGNTSINTNGDTEIQVTEAAAFTGSIAVNNMGISDLTGVEAFTSIEGLIFGNNSVSSVNLSTLTNLETLYCPGNSLTSLDFSNNSSLMSISINNNQLTAIDVSVLPSLNALRFSSNSISTLDISNCTQLNVLECAHNNLTSLDLSSISAIQTLHCSGNDITSLDVSNQPNLFTLRAANTLLTSIDVSNASDLEELDLQNTPITSLDVSSNQYLDNLKCHNLWSQGVLTYLNVANGNNANFTTFMASGNPNLTCIQVDDVTYSTTNWLSIDAQTSFDTNCPCTVTIPDANFKSYLVGNTAINTNGDTEIQCSEASGFTGSINCTNQSISDLTGIEAFTSLTVLRCGSNSLTTLDVSQNTALTLLDFEHTSVMTIDLSQNVNLESLFCYSSPLQALDLSNNTALKTLSLGDCPLSALDISANTLLEDVTCRNTPITALNTSSNPNLMYAVFDNNAITSLDFASNGNLVQAFCQVNALTSLMIANGNNTGISYMNAGTNPDLTCIEIDDGFMPPASWVKDPTASYDGDCATMSVDQLEQEELRIFPNPTQDELNLYSGATEVETVQIFTVTGQDLYFTPGMPEGPIDVSDFEIGTYILRINTEQGVTNIPFVKE